METNPLSETLFDVGAVEDILTQAERQAKSVASLLQFRQETKRKRSSSRNQRTPKYVKNNQQQKGKQQGQTPQNQSQNQQSQGTPSRNYPTTPRRNNYRGKGRGGRSPGTPRNTPKSQTPKQQF